MNVVERTGVTTFKGLPVTLLGKQVSVGQIAPAFTVFANDFTPVTLESSAGMVRLIAAVPSLETPVCDQQTRRFNSEAAQHPGIKILTVSVDLPFTQARWCGESGIAATQTVSDYRDLSFGLAYGVVIKEFRLLARAVFVIGADDVVSYAEYVPAVGQHPDYDAALAAVRACQASMDGARQR